MRDENDISESIVDNIIYFGINTTLICAIIAFLSCGFAVITLICNLLAKLVTLSSQRLIVWYKKRKTYISKSKPKNVLISSSEEGEVLRDNNKSELNRTSLSLEAINFDSSSDMEYFSLDGDDFDENEILGDLSHEHKTVNFANGVKCHSTPNTTNQDTDLTLPFTYVKNPIYIL